MKKTHQLAALVVAVTTVLSSSVVAQQNQSQQQQRQGGGNEASLDADRQFVQESVRTNLFEIAAGKAVAQRAESQEVKQFAQMMVDFAGLSVIAASSTAGGAPQQGNQSAPAPAANPAAERSQYGATFGGTWAYDSQVGYDYGQYDDNKKVWEQLKEERPKRMPGSRPDPGDWDFFDPYYQSKLYNDRTFGDYDDLGGYMELHGRVGRDRYWRSRDFIPLRYDDFGEYQRFRYDLGGR